MLTIPAAPAGFGDGFVAGFEDHAASLARIQVTQRMLGGQIDPDYVDNQRVMVRMGNGRGQVVLLPKGMAVQLGDRVTFQGSYRNMKLPCNYIPALITSDLGPAPPPRGTDPTGPAEP